MRLSGEAALSAPVAEVYRALHDPRVLVRTIPGCQRLDRVGGDAYQMTVSAGVAAVKGTFNGTVMLSDADPPHAFVLTANGSGGPGTVSTQVQVRLSDNGDGGTVLSYDADADVGGPIGGVGQRLLASVAHKTAHEFFTAVDEVLAGPAEEATPAAEVVAGSWTAPPATRASGLRPFFAGAAFGAAVALLGAVVGGLVATRAVRKRPGHTPAAAARAR